MIKITLKSTNYLKNTFIVILGSLIFGFIGIALMIVFNQNSLKMELWPNCSRNEAVNCYKRQERNIPFKVIGVLQTQNNIHSTQFIHEDIRILPNVQPKDFLTHFELNTFIKQNKKLPPIDFSKVVVAFILYNIPNNVLEVKIHRVFEFVNEPEVFDGCIRCDDILVGIDILVETGVDDNIFPATIILIQIDIPKEWKKENISFWPYLDKSNKLWNNFLKGVYR